MGHLMFYLAAVAACLLWSAAFVAAATRTDRTWLRRLLVAVAVVVPPLGLAPWVWFTGGLAALGLRTNWFAPTLTAFIAAVIGGLWISAAGLSRRPPAGAVAAAWPVVGLAAGFVLAKACAFGTLLFIDNAVAAEGRMLRVEAAQMMAAALPPAPGPDENAAPLYERAFAALAADKSLIDPESPFNALDVTIVETPEVAAILTRHAGTLDLLRRATDKPGCRFDRDWSRPSFFMTVDEVQYLRQAARLLALADLADGRLSLDFLEDAAGEEVAGLLHTGSLLYRCFMLPAEETGYRSIMQQYQNLYASPPRGGRFPEMKKQIGAIEDGLEKRREGIFSLIIVPALRRVLASQASGEALHAAAEVFVAATRARLQTGALPGSAADLVPERLAALPIDPFTTDALLRSKTTDDAWVVYSVGPDGEDDGGPLPPGAEDVKGNDDVGLRMAIGP